MSANALYITSMHHGKCIINSQNIHSSIFVSPNTTSIYRFAKSQDLRESKSRKGVYIICNTKVSITAYSKINSKRATFLLLPVQMLGKEYVVPSYMSTSNRYGHSSIFAVVAVYTDTKVNITVRSGTKGNVNLNNKRHLNGSEIFMNMTYLDTMQISEYKGDLSGTYINASKPVAVISGHTCVFMRNSYCGRLMEMIIAIKDFSKRFIIPKLERSERVKLRAYSYVKTDMFCSYLNKSNISFSLHSTDFLELDYEDLTTVRTTGNIHIQLYRGLFGGSSMTTVPGTNQYLSYYMFFVPYGYQKNYLSIIIRSDGIKGIRINKKEIETLQNRTFDLIGTQYTTFVWRILSGRHTAEQIQNVPFGLVVFAENPKMRHDVNFGYLVGMSLLPSNGT
ncbi:IgGFc-binding protein-like [Mytilus californianus]|uniref:IgGFc-binding protein-like n=1 Tax=Mytilus californianus TaxID=6549 RepID=UPI00224810CD|nr:IgGFc-binding protein-like [Mytilus californianus]